MYLLQWLKDLIWALVYAIISYIRNRHERIWWKKYAVLQWWKNKLLWIVLLILRANVLTKKQSSVNHKLCYFILDNITKLVTISAKFVPWPLTKLLRSSTHYKFVSKWWVHTSNVFTWVDRDRCNSLEIDACRNLVDLYRYHRRLYTDLSLQFHFFSDFS